MIKSTLLSCLLAGSLVTMLAAESSAPPAGPENDEVEVALAPMAEHPSADIDEEIAHLHAELARLVGLRVEMVKQQIEELHAQGRHEEAERLAVAARRRLAELGAFLHGQDHDKQDGEHAQRLERHLIEMEQKVHHLMETGHEAEAERVRAELADVLQRVVREKPELAPRVHAFVEGQIRRAHEHLEHLYDAGELEAAVDLEHRLRTHLKAIHEQHADKELVGLYLKSLHREIEAHHARGDEQAAEKVEHELHRVKSMLEDAHAAPATERDGANDDRRERIVLHEQKARVEAAKQRIEHMWVAADHLEEAGLHDEAAHLRREAEETHRAIELRMRESEAQIRRRDEQAQMHDHFEAFAGEIHEHARHMMQEIEMLHREVAELREIVGDLQRRLDRMQDHRE
jgi:Skp family chaperone for outer membrane proteins